MSSLPPVEALRPDAEEGRRLQLIETTLDSLAEVGFVGSTLSQIAGRANVSPGLVAHYFGDKDGLLDAAVRTLTARVGEAVTELDLLRGDVVVFRHAGHGGLNVVYRRADGNIGWIDPALGAN